MKELSTRALEVAESITLAITAKAKELKAKGLNVISFSAGEPDFDTSDIIKKAAIDRINFGNNGYTASSGILELKQEICKKFKRDNNIDYKPNEVVVSTGAKQVLYNAFRTLINDGDEVLVPSPYWISYEALINLVGGKVVKVPTRAIEDYELNVWELERHITEKSKVLLLNSPNNPTGAVYSEKTLREIAKIVKKYDLYVISDEIYEKIIFDEKHFSIASIDEDMKYRTITINGMSKAYAMTGWRIGYSASNSEISKIINNLQSNITSNPNTIAQYASLAGLKLASDFAIDMCDEFKKRRDFFISKIKEIKTLSCIEPKGAFYILLDVSFHYGKSINGKKIVDSISFSKTLLEEMNVATIPGKAFGIDTHIRLSYATSIENIEVGIDRIREFCENLK